MRDPTREYYLYRIELEIRELRKKFIEVEKQKAIDESNVIIFKIILFLIGMAVGAFGIGWFVFQRGAFQ